MHVLKLKRFFVQEAEIRLTGTSVYALHLSIFCEKEKAY